MKLHYFLLITFHLSLFTLKVSGQNKPCNNFDCAYKKAENFLKQAAYQKALDNLDSAEGYLTDTNTKEKEQIKQLRRRLFVAIEKEKEDAKKARDEAKRQKTIVEQQSKRLEIQIAKNEKIIKALFFYKEKYALVYQQVEQNDGTGFVDPVAGFLGGKITRQGFYFIDKEGNSIFKDKYFDFALPFQEEIGLAKVKVNNHDSSYCYLDTLGNMYPLALKISQLTHQIEALNLFFHQLTDLPNEIFKFQNLKILILTSNELTSLSSEIGNLSNLLILNLKQNQISKLPKEISNLKSLKFLNLEENQIPKEEQERIKKLLPNCEIQF
jgi:hypothetical protein